MFCSNCGAEVSDGHSFCTSCGSPLNGAAPAQATATYQPAPEQEGCLKAAWRDIKGSEHWFKRILLLCIMGCIPILNLGVAGYAIRWARELYDGQRNSMPQQIFRKHEISTGFFAIVVQLGFEGAMTFVLGAGFAIIGAIFGLFSSVLAIVIICLLGIVASVFCLFFVTPCEYIAVMRMSIVGHLEAGFNFKNIWKSFSNAKGSAICAAIVPAIIIGVLVGLVATILGVAMGVAAYNGMSSYYYDGYYYGDSGLGILNSISAISGIVILLLVVFVLFIMFLSVFMQILTYRAFGHWAARNGQSWRSENDDEGFAIEDEAAPVAAPDPTPVTE